MIKNKSIIKVAIGMSGGVDSSVAAKILKNQGYKVVGFMMKLWSEQDGKCDLRDNACCDIEGMEDAKRIASILDIPFYVVDVREKFKKEIADYFIEEYKNLRTPNPCVKCNEKIKFGWLLDFAKKTGCDFLATGHYARISEGNSGSSKSEVLNPKQITNSKIQNSKPINQLTRQPVNFHLLKGKDESKDQSYFLYELNQDQLAHIIFPVGEYLKSEVRALAKKWKLPVHEKKESQEICFIKDNDYRNFLKRNIPKKYFKAGDIVDSAGNVIGRHGGLINYTIGQRKGIEQITKSKLQMTNKNPNSEIQNGKQPLYVIGFNVNKNQLIVGEDKEVYKNEMVVDNLSWIKNSDNRYQRADNLLVKIRYRHPAVLCHPVLDTGSSLDSRLRGNDKKGSGNDKLVVQFREAQRAITPGQSAVFYSGNEVLGGGIIQ